MKVEANIAAWRQLAAVEQDAARLREVHAPLTLLGRGSNNERIAAARMQSDAVRGLEQLTASLRDAEVPSQAIDDAQHALDALQRAAVRTRPLNRAGTIVETAAARIRTTAGPQLEQGMLSYMKSLIETPVGATERTRAAMIDTLRLAAMPEVRAKNPALAQIDAADLLQVVERPNGASDNDLGARTGRVVALALTPDKLHEQIAATIHSSTSYPGALEASFLATVAERDPSLLAAYPSLQPELLHAVAHKRSVENVVALGAALGTEHARMLSPADLAAAATETLKRPYLEFTPRDAAVIRAALHREIPGIADRWPQQFAGMEPLDSVLEKFASSSYPDVMSRHQGLLDVTRYVGQLRASNMSPDERVAAADAIIATSRHDMRRADLATLAGVLRTPERSKLHLPPDVPGMPTFDELVERQAAGDQSGSELLRHYLQIRGMNIAPPARQQQIVDALATSTTSDLAASQWDVVYALTTGGFPGVQRPASWSPDDVVEARTAAVNGMVSDNTWWSTARSEKSPATFRLLEQLRLDALPAAELTAAADSLLHDIDHARTQNDWRRIDALLSVASSTHSLPVLQTIPGQRPLADIVRSLAETASPRAEDEAAINAYLDATLRADVSTTGMDVSEALYEAAHGSLSDASRSLLDSHDRIVDSISTGLPARDQLMIHATRLGQPNDLRTKSGAESFLTTITPTLHGFHGTTPMAESLRSETAAIADLNLARLNGTTPVDAVRGYARHPDYAEVGEVRAGAEIIASAERMTAKAAAAERSAARRAARASASAPTAAPSDVIDW